MNSSSLSYFYAVLYIEVLFQTRISTVSVGGNGHRGLLGLTVVRAVIEGSDLDSESVNQGTTWCVGAIYGHNAAEEPVEQESAIPNPALNVYQAELYLT